MYILSVSRAKIAAYKVNPGKAAKQLIGESTYANPAFSSFLKLIRKHVGRTPVRILLTDDISYILTSTVPPETEDIRAFARDIVQTEIPETSDDKDWDFRIIKRDKIGIQIIIAAPVLSVWEPIHNNLVYSSVRIEAVEPETIAKVRNADPIIGLAKKQDIEGKDEQILNLVGIRRTSHTALLVVVLLTLFFVILGLLYVFL